MDKIDYLILSELLKNSQTPFLKIAKKLGVSSFTVSNRYEKMKNEGIITSSTVNIDLSRLGYQGKVFLFITNAPNMAKSVTIDSLKKIRNIIVVSEIIGPFDIIAIAPIIDLSDVRALVNGIKSLPSVQRVQISCINDTMFPINSTFGNMLSEQSYSLAMQK
jgi:DNA-binding Lrp family transcriptional regulator